MKIITRTTTPHLETKKKIDLKSYEKISGNPRRMEK
jgi:hypothetical protein